MWTVAQIHFCQCLVWELGLSWTLGDWILVPMFQNSGLQQHLGCVEWITHFVIPEKGKNEVQTITAFNKHCPSSNPHHTWGGTFEPTFPFRCLRKRSANRMNELEQTGIYVKTSLNWEGKQDMCSCSHNSSGKLIPSHSQGWSTPPEDLIFPHFLHSENIFLKKIKSPS